MLVTECSSDNRSSSRESDEIGCCKGLFLCVRRAALNATTLEELERLAVELHHAINCVSLIYAGKLNGGSR